jgi:hypothetical protein
LYVVPEPEPALELPPPQAFSRTRNTHNAPTHSQRLCRFRRPTQVSKIPVSGVKAKARAPSRIPFGFSSKPEPVGIVTVNLKGTGKGPGVIVEGEKLQVAFAGSELCKQESVIAYFGSPVFAFN